MDAQMLRAIQDRFEHADALNASQFQFINLDRVQQEAGDRWDTLKERVFDVSEHFIQKRLNAYDVLIRCADGFLVLFAGSDQAANERLTKRISAELNAFYVGEEALKPFKLRSKTQSVTPETLRGFIASEDGYHEDADDGSSANTVTDLEIIDTQAEVVYWPLWDVAKGAVTTNVCLAKRGDDFAEYGHAMLSDRKDPDLDSRLDIEVAKQSAPAIQALLDEGRAAIFALSVNYSTIANSARRIAYLKAVEAIPERLRRYIVFKIDQTPPDAAPGTIQESFRIMRKFGSGLICDMALSDMDFGRFEGAGVDVFGVQCPSHSRGYEFSHKQQIQLSRFVHGAEALGARAMQDDVCSMRAFMTALDLGVRIFTGPIVAGERDKPVGAYPKSIDQIMTGAA